jgi:hypothetical protein
VEFTLPLQKGDNVQFGSTERHVLILSGDCGVVWLYQLRSEVKNFFDFVDVSTFLDPIKIGYFQRSTIIGIIACPSLQTSEGNWHNFSPNNPRN